MDRYFWAPTVQLVKSENPRTELARTLKNLNLKLSITEEANLFFNYLVCAMALM